MTITANAFGRESSLSPKMCEEAMEWWLDMQEANFDSPAQAAFMAWRSEHPLHELAWEKALALGAQLDSLRTQGDPDLARQALLLPSQEGLSRRRAIKGREAEAQVRTDREAVPAKWFRPHAQP